MEICVKELLLLLLKIKSKIPIKIKFNKDDQKILNNYIENLNNIRIEIDNQNINFYINFIVNSLFEANKYFNDQEPWKKRMIKND